MIRDNYTATDFQKILSQYNIGLFISRQYFDFAVENLNYKITTTKGKFLLKVFENKDINALEFQNRLIHYLASQKVKVVPLIVAKDKKDIIQHNFRYVSIFIFIEGEHLGKLSPRGCMNLAREVAALHQALLKYKLGRKYRNMYYSAQDKKLFRKKKLKKTIIHGDLGESNILTRGNVVLAILDFNDASYNYIVADLARLIASVFIEKRNIKYYPQFMQEYEKIIGLTNDERIILPHFINLRINRIVDYLSAIIKKKRYKPQQLVHLNRGLKEYQNKLTFMSGVDLNRS